MLVVCILIVDECAKNKIEYILRLCGMFNYFLGFISSFFLIYGLYYAVTGVFAFKKMKEVKPKTNKKNKFSIIIAARNEEAVIGNLIDSLKKQNYDSKDYEINVIINNSTDKTYEVSKEHGANAIKCEVPVSSKGEVLRYVFAKFKNKKFDAYIIFDADNVVHPDFLLHMNKSLNNGYRVAQGFRDSKNYQDNWISGSYTLFYYIQNFFFNLSRKKLNSSASINGTGFMVQKEFIENLDFNPVTLTEDVELTTVCAIHNEKIDFVKNAITYDEQPTLFRVSLTQRLRWSKGNLQCWKKYHHKLVKSFMKNHNLAAVDMYLNNLAAIVQVISMIIVLVGLIERMITTKIVFSVAGILGFLVSYFATLVVTLFVTIYNKKSITAMLPSLILFTVFMLSWLPINVVCLFKKNVKWNHIGHNKNINIDDIIKSS
jgi:cellulose synthase/poly-beta-1,6-N-acetylglucosamine synthase-like glycosyltransferase